MDVIINNPPAQTTQLQGMPYGYGYGYPQHQHGFGGFFLLPLLILAAVFFAKRRRFALRGGPPALGADHFEGMRDKFRQGRAAFVNDQALSIARERYAKGEINAEEYETLRRTLSDEGRPARPEPEKGDLKL